MSRTIIDADLLHSTNLRVTETFLEAAGYTEDGEAWAQEYAQGLVERLAILASEAIRAGLERGCVLDLSEASRMAVTATIAAAYEQGLAEGLIIGREEGATR